MFAAAEKIVKEVDRQLRGHGKKTTVTLQMEPSGDYASPRTAQQRSQRPGIHSVQTSICLSRGAVASPLQASMSNGHTKIINRATVDRPVLPYSEASSKFQHYDEHQFRIEEASMVSERSSLSLILHELCCAKPRSKLVVCQKDNSPGVQLQRLSQYECVPPPQYTPSITRLVEHGSSRASPSTSSRPTYTYGGIV